MNEVLTKRAPFQVVVFPFRRSAEGVEYAVFRRSDNGWWQGLAGGGEGEETPAEAARREAFEEGNVPLDAAYFALDSSDMVPVRFILESKRLHWPANTLVIPNYSFAVDCTGHQFVLSHEHDAVQWAAFDLAERCLTLDNNRAALWELDQRIKRSLLADKAV